jgi:hypothetical protein
MKKTRELENLIIKLQSGEIGPEEQQRLEELIKEYPNYQPLLKTHQMLAGMSQLLSEPQAAEFKRMRDTVMSAISRRSRSTRLGKLSDWLDTLRFYFQRPEIAVAALTLLVGFFLGRLLPPESTASRGFMKQINLIAAENKQLKDVQNSPYRYSNVSFNEIDSQNIALNFDVSTHMELVRPKSDPLVREVISQALLNPVRSGSELKTIALSETIVDRKIKEALIFSLENAPMLAVRMKSLDVLSKYKNDPEVEAAFIKVLQAEQSVQIRLSALDYLEEVKVDRNVLKKSLAGLDMRTSSAVLLKANKYINQEQNNTN